MSLEQFKITESDKQNNGVVSAPDTLTGTAQQNKTVFDKLVGFVADKYNNALTYLDDMLSKIKQSIENVYTKSEVDGKLALKANNVDVYKKTETYNQQEINGKLALKANSADVYKKNETFTKQEVTTEINNAVFNSGSSDMTKAVYDKNNNGIVDNAERLGGQLPQYYAKENNSWSLSGGTQLQETTDLNTVLNVGNYYSLNWGKTLPNAPIRDAFIMKVYRNTGTATDQIIQEVQGYSPEGAAGLEYKRRGYRASGNVWKFENWIQSANTKQLNEVKAIAQNAMPKSGGQFTGSVTAMLSAREINYYNGELMNISVYSADGRAVSSAKISMTRK